MFASLSRIFPAFENQTYYNKSPQHRSMTWYQNIRGYFAEFRGMAITLNAYEIDRAGGLWNICQLEPHLCSVQKSDLL